MRIKKKEGIKIVQYGESAKDIKKNIKILRKDNPKFRFKVSKRNKIKDGFGFWELIRTRK